MIDKLSIVESIKRIEQRLIERHNDAIQIRGKIEDTIVKVEQEVTENYLDNIEVQQMITELELMIIGGNHDI